MKYYSVDDVANYFNVQNETVRRWLRSGALKGTGGKTGGRHWKISEDDLYRFKILHPEYPIHVMFSESSMLELSQLMRDYETTAKHLQSIMLQINNLLRGN